MQYIKLAHYTGLCKKCQYEVFCTLVENLACFVPDCGGQLQPSMGWMPKYIPIHFIHSFCLSRSPEGHVTSLEIQVHCMNGMRPL